MINAKDIKTWLKEIGKNREWLAEKTLVSKRTVDNWITTDRPIPPAKLALIERLMSGEEEIEFELPPDFEKQLRAMADEMHKSLEDMVSHILQVTARANRKKKSASRKHVVAVETLPAVDSPRFPGKVIGNIAAGDLMAGDTIPYEVDVYRPLDKDEYILRVEGHSMEPEIENGSLVIMRKYTAPPVPSVNTIIQYHDERGVTLKKLGIRDVDGKPEYVLHAINPDFSEITPMDGGCISAIYVETIK